MNEKIDLSQAGSIHIDFIDFDPFLLDNHFGFHKNSFGVRFISDDEKIEPNQPI